ncbi:MAG: MarR family transcriptional regulator [Burkholderiales bacterium]|nr:MarR family transcriptional regulator [Burkholderiales bacterium]
MSRDADKLLPDALLRHWREAVPDDRLAHLVKDATRAFVRALQLRLVEHSVSFGHWTFLRILWEHDGLTQRELSDEAGVMEPTTHAAIKAMEELGYVERRRKGENRRSMHIHLTPAGRALRERLVPLAIAVNDAAVRGVAEADIAATRRVLLAVIENLAASELAGGQRLPSTRTLARPATAPRRVVTSAPLRKSKVRQ